MKRQISLALISLCLAAATHAQILEPKVGAVRYSTGGVHNVYGLNSNYIIGPAFMAHADAASFSDKFGLVSSLGMIHFLDSAGHVIFSYAANEPRPVLNVDSTLESAVAWLPLRHRLIHWNGKELVSVEVPGNLPGAVSSIKLQDANTAALLTVDSGRVYRVMVSLDSGDLAQMSLEGESLSPAFEKNGYVLFRNESGWELRAPDGSVSALALPSADFQAEEMSTQRLHLISGATNETNQNWVLSLSPLGSELSELPAPPAAGGAQ